MVAKVTLISNLKMNIVTKFQFFIFKNDKVRNKLDRRQRGIGLITQYY